MGRTYIVEESVGQYISSISLQGKSFVSGLLIGQVCMCLPLCILLKINYSFIKIKYAI